MPDSQDLAVRYEGQGLPVLVIHGWGISGAVEAHDLEPIFDKLDGYRRVYVDLPGMGKTPAQGIKSLDDMFQRLSTFVDKHILPSRFLVTMHSAQAPFLKPTLILTGRQDSVVGYRDSWPLLKSYPRASFVALDRADHGLPVDKHETDLFRALVTNWFRRVEEVRQLN